jgi:integrase/recombinase XerD
MNALELNSNYYQNLKSDFKEWLEICGYSQSTIYNAPYYLNEFFYFLDWQNKNLEEVNNHDINTFFSKLEERPNYRRGGGLSSAHLNKSLSSLKLFNRYLIQKGYYPLEINRKKWETERNAVVLSQKEIKDLYKASDQLEEGQKDYRLRDKAILAVFYGCGLRRNEGANLILSDILFEKKRIYVRKTKNKHERYVPMSKQVLRDLEAYVYDLRPDFLREENDVYSANDCGALFLSFYGKRLSSQSLYNCIKSLQQRSNNEALKEKEIALHTLRHSIASHLVQEGMKIEDVSLFLGHRSLESTQIYVHLAKELEA